MKASGRPSILPGAVDMRSAHSNASAIIQIAKIGGEGTLLALIPQGSALSRLSPSEVANSWLERVLFASLRLGFPAISQKTDATFRKEENHNIPCPKPREDSVTFTFSDHLCNAMDDRNVLF